jgi:hypothetical protein
MGTAHKPKSTRASRGRSDRSSLRSLTKPTSRQATAPPWQKPAPQKRAGLRRTAERLRVQPRPNPEAMGARIDQPRTGKLSPVKALPKILAQLQDICSTAIVVHHALREQNVDLDNDAADVLKLHVSDPLYDQILKLKRIVGGGAS